MAYLRKEEDKVELTYPLSKVWNAILKALKDLDWVIQNRDDENHQVKAKTAGSFMAMSSIIQIETVATDENTTRVKVSAETPVTTITAIVDFGQTRKRIELLYAELLKQLEPKKEGLKAPKRG
jgi:hypothetical protein